MNKPATPANSTKNPRPLAPRRKKFPGETRQPDDSSSRSQPAGSYRGFQPAGSYRRFQPTDFSCGLQPADYSSGLQPTDRSSGLHAIESTESPLRLSLLESFLVPGLLRFPDFLSLSRVSRETHFTQFLSLSRVSRENTSQSSCRCQGCPFGHYSSSCRHRGSPREQISCS